MNQNNWHFIETSRFIMIYCPSSKSSYTCQHLWKFEEIRSFLYVPRHLPKVRNILVLSIFLPGFKKKYLSHIHFNNFTLSVKSQP
jgi:hypothetical protein